MMLTSRFEEALLYATRLHAEQLRKGSGTPYVAHLLAVTALVIEDGGDEDEAIAALLHDAIEDQGGLTTRDEIRRRFGERVTILVEAMSDAYTQPKPPWQARKEAFLERMPQALPEVLRLIAADKLHNLRTILAEYRLQGEAIWPRFNGGRDGTLWYYRETLRLLQAHADTPLIAELARTLAELEALLA